ncbi:MAG: peptide chain release factor N(5)-glutamine methyltransferase [Gammaproteobacteria bacterium]|nr:peptide chain release factor N(5)-glutamine methyltransferase [Gammaproteobacteria bacterium]
MVIEALLNAAAAQLKESTTAKLDVALLLTHLLQVPRSWLYSHSQQTLSAAQIEQFQALLQRRLNGEPVSYIIGVQEFWSLPFKVTADVLIPRPESELLVERALSYFSPSRAIRVVDLGCGSGAVGLALAHERPQWQVILVDKSEAALAIAKENCQRLNLKNVCTVLSDWCQQLVGQSFELIVSNPPYIAVDEPHYHDGDLRFEPAAALLAGEDGLAAIRQIIAQAGEFLVPQGWLMLEHGYRQHRAVAEILRQQHFGKIASYRDLANIKRLTLGQWP